jgi:anaerobic selenocysteine-containing dehydrogenase
MTLPLSSARDIDFTVSRSRFRRQAFCISGKIILVIHPELVERLGINNGTWIEEEETDYGISLTICNSCEQDKVEMNTRGNEGKHLAS